MNALITPGGPLTMTSREIAELTGKSHGNVMRDIRVMMDALEQDSKLNPVCKSTTYAGTNGQTYDQYELDKDTCLTLLLGYDAVARMKVVKRWQELEAVAQAPAPTALSRMQILEIAMESEKARIEAEAQRDEAVRTKALIGSKREATAMSTAAKAVREVKRLTAELGRNARHATVIAVEKATGRKFGPQDWRPLREFCKKKGLATEKVIDPRWGEVKAWPSEAWSAVYGIDLHAIFPEPQVGMH
jgi:phage regulator Rha-like protein